MLDECQWVYISHLLMALCICVCMYLFTFVDRLLTFINTHTFSASRFIYLAMFLCVFVFQVQLKCLAILLWACLCFVQQLQRFSMCILCVFLTTTTTIVWIFQFEDQLLGIFSSGWQATWWWEMESHPCNNEMPPPPPVPLIARMNKWDHDAGI